MVTAICLRHDLFALLSGLRESSEAVLPALQGQQGLEPVEPPNLDSSVQPGCSRMTKRPCGGDAWINSGGARGGRSLRDEDGHMIVRRRYGKIVAFSAGGRAALKRGAGVLRDSDPSLGDCRQEWRYQEYNLLKHGQDGQVVEDRDVRLYHILPPDSVPMLGIPSSIHLTGAERAYLHAVSVYASNQAKGLALQRYWCAPRPMNPCGPRIPRTARKHGERVQC